MPEMDGFKDGLPSWVDLASPDPDESASFYGELLGLEVTDPDEQYGGYCGGLESAAGSMTEVAPAPLGGSTFCSRSATGS